jgi:predicted DNA-binding transcriptional regulator YafY
MSRSARLLDLLQLLRRHRQPVSGDNLARELGISIRTLYRDIATLQAQGADITGEPGIGYILKPGFMLPPLMFSEDELEALVLGSRWVSKRAGGPLGKAAENALAKIASVLPKDLRTCPPSGLPSARSASWISAMRTRPVAPASARSGPLRWASSIVSASSWPGASCAATSGIFVSTASPTSRPPTRATRAARLCC